ncbi:MAG: hypothetical protein FJW34_01185 [Acidobacteria bacterium]|nr:hypothetical protein [Acidobacteriota bacterium]
MGGWFRVNASWVASVAALLGLLPAAYTAHPDYFPLSPGNQWVYRSSGRAGSSIWALEVAGAEILEAKLYWRVRGMAGLSGNEALLRMDEDGTLYMRAPDRAAGEEVWAAFGTREGQRYRTGIDPCNRDAQIESRSARYTGPVGESQTALKVAYLPAGCADAGLTEEFFLPYVGLVRRTATTIAGPVSYDLIYARLGGVTYVSEREASFHLSLDRPVYYANFMPPIDPRRTVPEMTARLTLRNSHPEPILLTFSSGQSFDLALKTEDGKEVYRWSEGRAFIQVIRRESPALGEKNYVVVVPLADKAGKTLPEGRYIAEGWLTTMGARAYSASVGFEIRYVY